MSVMRALEVPEYIYSKDGKKRITHEAFSYLITPFEFPPIKVQVYKGLIDRHGVFQPVPGPPKIIALTQDEFKELLNPNSFGKPAGDFRISDILRCLTKRTKPDGDKKAAEAKPAVADAAAAPAEAEKKDSAEADAKGKPAESAAEVPAAPAGPVANAAASAAAAAGISGEAVAAAKSAG